MKRSLIMLTVVAVAVIAFFVPVTVSQAATEVQPTLSADCPICDLNPMPIDEQLSQAEIDDLLLALKNEYHAWAVYDQVIQDFGPVRPFATIQQAAGRHIDALLGSVRYLRPIGARQRVGRHDR